MIQLLTEANGLDTLWGRATVGRRSKSDEIRPKWPIPATADGWEGAFQRFYRLVHLGIAF